MKPNNNHAWEQHRLDELFIKCGSGGTPNSSNKNYYGGNIPFLGISDLKERYISNTEKTITEEGLKNSAAWIVPAGSISLAMYASVGKVGILSKNTATSQAFFNMVFDDNSVRDFIYTRLEKADYDHEWEPLISTGTQRNLNAEKLKSFKIKVPTLEEQKLIALTFTNLDSLLALHQRVHFGITINHLKNPNAWEQHELWKLTIWDKRFNEVDKEKQPETRKYRYALADAINLIIIPGGDIKILSTGSLDAYTTKERAGEYLCNGEIVAIPWGGTPNIKYAKGFFVTGDNRIATSNDLDKLNNRYLYWWFNTPLKHL